MTTKKQARTKRKPKYIMGECESCGRPERIYAKPEGEHICPMCGREIPKREPLQKKVKYYARVPRKSKRKHKVIEKW